MYRRVLTFKNNAFCTYSVYMFRETLTTNFFPIQISLTGTFNVSALFFVRYELRLCVQILHTTQIV